MLKYTNLNRVMKITDHFKNRAQLISLKNRVALVLAMLLLPMCLVAQITFAEKQPVDNTPEWWHLKDKILMPYDSTYLKIQLYPTLEAYKKYIGQILFYMAGPYMAGPQVLFLSKNAIILEGERNKIEKPVKRDKIEKPVTYYYNQFFAPQNKYFDIIDVISLADIEYKKRFDSTVKAIDRGQSEFLDKFGIWMPIGYYDDESAKYGKYCATESKNFPVFVLRETETGDTLYSTCFMYTAGYSGGYYYDKLLSSPLILVGGFVKLKEEFVGQTILKMNSAKYSTRSFSEKILQKWTCVDVSIADGNRGQYIALVLQSENDNKKEYLAYTEFLKDHSLYDYKYITGEQYLKMEQEAQKANKESEQKLAEEGQEREKKINERKNKLTAEFGAGIAEKIIAGKFVVGMSKKACKETMQSLTDQIVLIGIPNAYMSRVVRSTATTEVWETYTQGLFGGQADGPFEYLHFNGDKLVKIDVIKNVFR